MPGPLKVTWFENWCGALDEALASLPERQCMPHALYKRILSTQRRERRRIARVDSDGVPILIAGLRHRSRYVWEPICNWQTPGPVFPARDDQLLEGLQALGLEVPLAWWRMGAPPTAHGGIRWVETSPTYRMELDADPEAFWRETDYLRTIKNIRNRCKSFSVEVNKPGAAEWTIRNWSEKWGIDQDTASQSSIDDRVTVVNELEARGLHLTISLLDDGELIGSSSNYVHNSELVAGVICFKDEYRSKGAGIRLIDLAFEVAAKRNLKAFDLGGKADYKQKWAPASGTRSNLVVAPRHIFYGRRALNMHYGRRAVSLAHNFLRDALAARQLPSTLLRG